MKEKEIPEIKNEINTAEGRTPTPVLSYKITRFDNGDISVTGNSIEGMPDISDEEIYSDIENVAEMIKMKRIENASYAGIARFYAELAARKSN